MRPFVARLLLISAGIIVLGTWWGCTYGQYEPDMWDEDSPIYQAYVDGDDDDDDNNNDNDDNNDDSGGDSDSDSDSDSDGDKSARPPMFRVPAKHHTPH